MKYVTTAARAKLKSLVGPKQLLFAKMHCWTLFWE